LPLIRGVKAPSFNEKRGLVIWSKEREGREGDRPWGRGPGRTKKTAPKGPNPRDF